MITYVGAIKLSTIVLRGEIPVLLMQASKKTMKIIVCVNFYELVQVRVKLPFPLFTEFGAHISAMIKSSDI